MLPEIESERKTKRKHKNVAKRARLLVSQSLRRVRFFPSLSLSLSCWFYSRSFSLSAPPPDGRRASGGGAVEEPAARQQDGSGGPPVACARQTRRTLVSHICYEDGRARSLGSCDRRPDNVLHPVPAFLPRTYLYTYVFYVLLNRYNYSFPVKKKFIFAKISHVLLFFVLTYIAWKTSCDSHRDRQEAFPSKWMGSLYGEEVVTALRSAAAWRRRTPSVTVCGPVL